MDLAKGRTNCSTSNSVSAAIPWLSMPTTHHGYTTKPGNEHTEWQAILSKLSPASARHPTLKRHLQLASITNTTTHTSLATLGSP
eukprot:10269390-Alexandrium_andersonii.AAC.1